MSNITPGYTTWRYLKRLAEEDVIKALAEDPHLLAEAFVRGNIDKDEMIIQSIKTRLEQLSIFDAYDWSDVRNMAQAVKDGKEISFSYSIDDPQA